MTYTLVQTSTFKRELKLAAKRGYRIELLKVVLEMLKNGESLPEKYHDHQLSGNLSDFRECHITPDWLLLYTKNSAELILTLTRTGTHSDLFKK